MEPIKVVIIEDHQATLDGLSIGLSQESDIQVIATSLDGDEGYAIVEEMKPDVVLLDLHLPGSAGPRSMVEKFSQLKSTKLVIFSAESRMAFIQTVLAMGVQAYLLKSERVAKVSETIRRVMKGETGIVSEQVKGNWKKLTRSEDEVLRMMAKGMKYQDIADARTTSITTVRKQCETLLLKLGLDTREQLIAWAVENGYGSVDLGARGV
ncbi:MAG: response regulator transcription factor [Candidatus Melainabacteria bacterium]|jgi:DNA-binding NarL/FixJ family response regulator|nr:response regulator transcription factor [Candidatus Melainabacteria bacterium]